MIKLQRNFKLNDLIDETNLRHLQSFATLQDTGRFVPEKYLEKMRKRIFKNQTKCYKIDKKTFKRYNKKLDRQERRLAFKKFIKKVLTILKRIVKKIFKRRKKI